jgi:hypothetical protein
MLTLPSAISLCVASNLALISDVSATSATANVQSATPTFDLQLWSESAMNAASETTKISVLSVVARYVPLELIQKDPY